MKKYKKIKARLKELQMTLEACLEPTASRVARSTIVATDTQGVAHLVGALLYDVELGPQHAKVTEAIARVISEYKRQSPQDYAGWTMSVSHVMENFIAPKDDTVCQVIYEGRPLERSVL